MGTGTDPQAHIAIYIVGGYWWVVVGSYNRPVEFRWVLLADQASRNDLGLFRDYGRREKSNPFPCLRRVYVF